MLLNSALLIVGCFVTAVGYWPAIKFFHERQIVMLPQNPIPVYLISLAIAGSYLMSLVLSLFIESISWWAILVGFFLAGPFGCDVAVKFIKNGGSYSTLLPIGALGVGILATALLL